MTTRKHCTKFLGIEVGIEIAPAESNSDTVSTLNFVNWVQSKYQLPNRTAAVKKAAEIMRAGENTVWQWLNGKRKASPSIQLLMEMIMKAQS